MITKELLDHLVSLATSCGGELHIDADETVLCFPNSTPPKRMEDEPWPVTSASTIGQPDPANQQQPMTSPNRHRVLNDMDQFLKEQQLNQETLERQHAMKKQAELRTGELPYRNYPDGRPPRQ